MSLFINLYTLLRCDDHTKKINWELQMEYLLYNAAQHINKKN